jgi:predicted dehydrogenase
MVASPLYCGQVAEPPDHALPRPHAVTRPSRHRIAIVGLGMAVAPHARSLRDLAGRVDVAAAFSPTRARRDAFAAQYGYPVVDDIDAIVDDASIDCALILTPPRTHLPLVERFAAAGKNILLEKPLEAETSRAEAAVDACARNGVTLGVVLQHRFRPGALALAECVAGDGLGQIANASVAVPWWRPQSYYDEPGRGTLARDGGGVLLTQAIHTLDLFLSLVAGRLDVHFHDGRVETAGERAAFGGGADPMAFAHDAHRALIAAFLDALDAGRSPPNDGYGALAVHDLIDAVLASARTHAFVPVPQRPRP